MTKCYQWLLGERKEDRRGYKKTNDTFGGGVINAHYFAQVYKYAKTLYTLQMCHISFKKAIFFLTKVRCGPVHIVWIHMCKQTRMLMWVVIYKLVISGNMHQKILNYLQSRNRTRNNGEILSTLNFLTMHMYYLFFFNLRDYLYTGMTQSKNSWLFQKLYNFIQIFILNNG